MRRTDEPLQRLLQLVFGLGEEQRPVAEFRFGGVGTQLGHRRLLPRDMVGDEAGEELHHRDGSLVDLARNPARGAQHAEQLVIGGDDGNAHIGPELEVLGHLAVGMGLGEIR